jgi:hypothetical protein
MKTINNTRNISRCKVLPLFNYALRYEHLRRSRGPISRILKHSTRWGLVSASRPAALPSGNESSLYPLDRRLCWPRNRSGRHGEEKNLAPSGTRTPIPSVIQPVAQSLYRLSYSCSLKSELIVGLIYR